jgi:GNAT superfamily N-acetyltransferase
MEIRKLAQSEKRMAMDLAWEVFIEFEGPDYPQEGTDHFRSFIDNTEMVGELEVYGAFDGNILAGMIALRSSGSHISLFFVRKTYQQRGIGKRLFETAIRSGHAGIPNSEVSNSLRSLLVSLSDGFRMKSDIIIRI